MSAYLQFRKQLFPNVFTSALTINKSTEILSVHLSADITHIYYDFKTEKIKTTNKNERILHCYISVFWVNIYKNLIFSLSLYPTNKFDYFLLCS